MTHGPRNIKKVSMLLSKALFKSFRHIFNSATK